MTDDHREIGELDVLAYADGLLDGDPARRSAVEAYLAGHPETAERARVYARQNEEIRRHYDSRLAEPVPERLTARLSGRSAGGAKAALYVSSGVAFALIAGAAGWLLGEAVERDRGAESPVAPFLEAVVADYRRSLDGLAAGGAVASTGRQPLSWLSRQAALELAAPELSARGYHLVDKRVVATADGSEAVRILYDSDDGRRLGLFMRLRWRKAEPVVRLEEADGVRVAHWLDGPILFSLVTDRGDARLGELAAWMTRTRQATPDGPPRLRAPPAAPYSAKADPAGARGRAAPTPQNPTLPMVGPAGGQ